MKQEVFITNIDNKIPMTVSIIKFDTIFHHMHSNPQLILLLDGECNLYLDETKHHLEGRDMMIVNRNTFHHLQSDSGCTIISVLLDLKAFGLDQNEIDQIEFNLNSTTQDKCTRCDQIRYLIYSIIKYNTMENVNSIYTNRAISFSFFAQLMNDFSVIKQTNFKPNDALSTLTTISAWMHDHYKECLSLSYICEEFNYTPSYLSRLFKQVTNYTFIELYDYIRVNYSLNDLLLTNKTIEDIAQSHGFENARSYVRAFKKLKELSPTEFRTSYNLNKKQYLEINPKFLKKTALDKILEEYDEQGVSKKHKKEQTKNTSVVLDINLRGSKTKLLAKGSDIIELSGAGDLFSEDTYKALKEAKNDINYKYILIPNIFSRKTYILTRDENGKTIVNFLYLYKLIQKTLDLHALPYMIFEYEESIVSIEEYYNLMIEVLDYLYGHFYNKIKNMMLSFSICETTNSNHNYTLNKDFFDVYVNLMNLYKTKIPHIKLGLPLFTKAEILNNSTYFDFLMRVRQYNINFDFIPIKYTNNKNEYLTKDKDDILNFIEYLKDKNGYVKDRICLHSISFSDNNLLNDTLYGASYVIKNYIDTCDFNIGFTKAKLQDSILINSNDSNPFHGENGLITYNGIKKSTYSAYSLISKLGKELVQKGKNYIITTNDNKIIILLNNYNHYSKMFAEKEYFEINNLDRYKCFPISSNINFDFNLNNIKEGNYEVTTYSINNFSGSAYDKWLSMGAKNFLSEKEIETLKNLSNINYKYEEVNSIGTKLNINFTVAPLESLLIEIKYNYK